MNINKLAATIPDLLHSGKAKNKGTYNSNQMNKGKKVEHEHTEGAKLDKPVQNVIAKKISKDHLKEIPDYYSRLKKMEDTAKQQMGKKAAKDWGSAKSLKDLYTIPEEKDEGWTKDLLRKAFLPGYPPIATYQALKRKFSKHKDDEKEDKKEKQASISNMYLRVSPVESAIKYPGINMLQRIKDLLSGARQNVIRDELNFRFNNHKLDNMEMSWDLARLSIKEHAKTLLARAGFYGVPAVGTGVGIASALNKEGASEGKGELTSDQESKIIEFVTNSENLDDTTFHAFCGTLGVSPHEAEEVVYAHISKPRKDK